MTDEIIEKILENQNKRRNEQALGNTPNYEPAVRMATIVWDLELAKLAEMNVRSCVYGHDACINTGKPKRKNKKCLKTALIGLIYWVKIYRERQPCRSEYRIIISWSKIYRKTK